MSPHRRHQLTAIVPWLSLSLAAGGVMVSVAGVVWVTPKVQAAVQAERDKAFDEYKAKINDHLSELERARRDDHELLIQIANDMGWVRRALEKTKP
jgi:hypothetical protein